MACFTKAAEYAYSINLTRFKFQPKFHMIAEVRWQLLEEKRLGATSINPLAYSCQMNEDFVGKIAQMSRMVASRRVHAKTIERYRLTLLRAW